MNEGFIWSNGMNPVLLPHKFNQMKKTQKTLFFAATLMTVLNFASCGKYDDGPGFSLRSKTSRITGEWEVVRIGSQTFPNQGYSLEFEFEKKGDFKYTYAYGTYSYSYAGDWEFSNDKEELELTFDGTVEIFEIKRLTNKELWLEDSTNDEWRLEAK